MVAVSFMGVLKDNEDTFAALLGVLVFILMFRDREKALVGLFFGFFLMDLV